MKSLLLFMVLGCQVLAYDQIEVERFWIGNVEGKLAIYHGGKKGKAMTSENAIDIATKYLTQLASEKGCVLPVFLNCKKLDISVLPSSYVSSSLWSVHFKIVYDGIRIDDNVFVDVSDKYLYPGGFLYIVKLGSNLKFCKGLTMEEAKDILCKNFIDAGDGVPKDEKCVVKLVWHYRTLPVGSTKTLFKYWKFMELDDEQEGVTSLVSYCDGSLIPD